MKKDIFTGISGCLLILALVGIFIIADIFASQDTSNILWTIFFFVLGALCLWNYSNCGRVHCQITGYGFIGVGVTALLNILNIINISWNIIWTIFIIVLIIGYGFEFIHKGKTGSCYRK